MNINFYKISLQCLFGTLIILPCLVYSNEAGPSDIEELSYGEIYLSQPERIIKSKTDFSLNYGAGLGVPEYKLHSLKLSGEHWLSENFWIGANFEYNTAVKSPLQKNVEALLARLGSGVSYEYPTMAFRTAIGFAPFSGLVNILGKKVLPYELSISAELGVVEYKSQTSPGPYIVANEKIWHGSSIGLGLDQRILIYKNSGVKIGYFQYFENSFSNTSSNQRSTVTIGWYGRF